MAELEQKIEAFIDGSPFAVVGASRDRSKYGNKVLRLYQQKGWEAYPVNPNAEEVEGREAYPDLSSLPQTPHAISVVTPPPVTAKVIDEAGELGIKHVWLQPGAESDDAQEKADAHGISLIAGGPCVLARFGFSERG